jgi:ABC-type nitrate/sulfonate/bicarbonate transport system permease component
MTASRSRFYSRALQVALPAAILVCWQVWSARAGNFFFPRLDDIFQAFYDNWIFARVASDVLPSLVRMLAGYSIAVVLALAVGVCLGLSNLLYRTASPIIEFVRAIPVVALIPFAILVFGIDSGMKVFIIVIGCIWPILLNTIDGIRSLNETLRDTARLYRLTPWEKLRFVILPAASPQIFAGLRTGMSLAVILMVISEMVASTNGIGFFIIQAQRTFAITDMWSGIVLLGLLGYGLNTLLLYVERWLLAWHSKSRLAEGV